MNKKTKLLLGFLPMLAVCIVIFWFSSNVAEDSSEQSSVIVDHIKEDVFPELGQMQTPQDQKTVDDTLSHIVRKAAHFSVYTLLGICAFAAFWFIRKKTFRCLAAWGSAALYAVSDEVHQHFVPGRSCEFKDVMIDSFGALIGVGLCLAAVIIIASLRSKKK
ncbi:MAG: VanZ family protein [Ruminococcus sp.]|nr:VanZ family protein [Ruminococcus sp.]